MSLTNRIASPNKEWVESLGRDVHSNIKAALAAQIGYSENPNPNRPPTPPLDDPGKLRTYADAIEKWNIEIEEWKKTRQKETEYNNKISDAISKYIQDESGLNSIPEQYRSKVYAYAWDQGHSSGYYEVYNYLISLVDIFK